MAILRMTRKEYEAKYGMPAPGGAPQQTQTAPQQQAPVVKNSDFLQDVGSHIGNVGNNIGKVFNDAAGEVTSLVTQPGKAAYDAFVSPEFSKAQDMGSEQAQKNINYAKTKGYKPGSAEYERIVTKPLKGIQSTNQDIENQRLQSRKDIDFTGLGNEDTMNLMDEGKYGQAFARSATGAPAGVAKATFAPLALPAEALIPGTDPASRAVKGGITGAMYGGPVGAAIGAGAAFLPEVIGAVKETPGIKDYLAANPQANKVFDDGLVLGLTILGQKLSKKPMPGKKGDILQTPVSQVPDTIFHNVANTAMAPLTAASKVTGAVGHGMKWAGDKLNSSAYTPSADEAKVIQNYNANVKFLRRELGKLDEGTAEYKNVSAQLKSIQSKPPVPASNTALREGLIGTEKMLGEQAKVESMDLWKNQVAPALKRSKARLTKEELFAPAREKIANEIEPTRKAALTRALESLEDEYKDSIDWDMSSANQLKSGLDKFTPSKIFKGQDVKSEVATLKAEMASAARQKIYQSIDDIDAKAAFRDYSNLKELQKVGIKAMTSSTQKGGFGSFWSGIYDQATTPIKTVGGQTLYRVGNFLEFTGHEGIKTLGQYLDDIHVSVVPKDFANLPNQQGGFIKNPFADSADDIDIQQTPIAPTSKATPQINSSAKLHQQNVDVFNRLQSDQAKKHLSQTLKPQGDLVKGPVNNYANPIHRVTKEVMNSTVDMADMYDDMIVTGKPLPLQMSNHIVDDIAGKLDGTFKMPELSTKVSTSLKGKTFNNLQEMQDAALKIILKEMAK